MKERRNKKRIRNGWWKYLLFIFENKDLNSVIIEWVTLNNE